MGSVASAEASLTARGPLLWLVFALVLAVTLPAQTMVAVLVIAPFRHAVRAGRGVLIAAWVAAAPPLTGAILALAAWRPWVDYTGPSPPGDLAVPAILLTTGICVLTGALAARQFASRMGFRPRGVHGPRPPLLAFRTWTVVVIFVTPAAAVTLWVRVDHDLAVIVAGVGILTVIGLQEGRRRSRAQRESLGAPELQRSVLYLRPFDLDQFIGMTSVDEVTATLEKQLAKALRSAGFRLVTVGDPQDLRPPEASTIRLYSDDDHWQDLVDHVMTSCLAVVLIPGRTVSLSWELRSVLTNGHSSKLFVLIPPAAGADWVARAMTWSARRVSAWRPVVWPDFATVLRDSGYTVGDVPAGPGSVVSFDTDGNALLLAKDLTSVPCQVEVLVKAVNAHHEHP